MVIWSIFHLILCSLAFFALVESAKGSCIFVTLLPQSIFHNQSLISYIVASAMARQWQPTKLYWLHSHISPSPSLSFLCIVLSSYPPVITFSLSLIGCLCGCGTCRDVLMINLLWSSLHGAVFVAVPLWLCLWGCFVFVVVSVKMEWKMMWC